MLSNEELKEFVRNSNNSRFINSFLTIDKKLKLNKWLDCRNFQVILYLEHFKDIEDLRNKCNDFPVPCLLSPPHDKDLEDDGITYKKVHCHFLAQYKGKTTLYQFYLDLCNTFGDNTFFGMLKFSDLGERARYWIHLDNKDKAQYNKEDIRGYHGISWEDKLICYGGDSVSLKKDLYKIINDNDILFYNVLENFLLENNDVLFASLTSNRNVKRDIIDYLKGREHELYYMDKIERSYTVYKPNKCGDLELQEKRIFNRQIKGASASAV